MVQLTIEEQEWLGANHPKLSYDITKGEISGKLKFKAEYHNKTIEDQYEVLIDFSKMANRSVLPLVYNPGDRIRMTAKRKGRSTDDFHLNYDGTLCLIFPPKVSRFYPNGFELPRFIEHLEDHLYWISYLERYDKEPWPGEKHGNAALLDMQIDEAFETNNFDAIRNLHKQSTKLGIAKSKLRRLLEDPRLRFNLKNKMKNGKSN